MDKVDKLAKEIEKKMKESQENIIIGNLLNISVHCAATRDT